MNNNNILLLSVKENEYRTICYYFNDTLYIFEKRIMSIEENKNDKIIEEEQYYNNSVNVH